jgi:Rrf2 family protein
MKLTTKMRYGTRAMLELALHQGEEPLSLREVAERQDISPKYLEQLFATLQTAGLVNAVRGPRGGYALARPAESINLRQIYEALESPDGFVACTANPQVCERADHCVTQEVWARLYQTCMQLLEETTLADLAARAREKAASGWMYYI